MSFTQKELIVAYREEGLSYREIADKTGTSEQFCRTVCSRANKRKKKACAHHEELCKFCEKPLDHVNGKRKKEFCSDQCRFAYYYREKKRKSYIRTCEFCGKEFVSSGNPDKRFCSRDCRTEAERRVREDH